MRGEKAPDDADDVVPEDEVVNNATAFGHGQKRYFRRKYEVLQTRRP